MPEIKHNFTGGKMNKDLDERLVPNGEYRDAMNIQVATSEGSDVGTVQNILGNKEIQVGNLDLAGGMARTIGSIADEKNDILYWLVWTENIDYIFSYKRGDLLADTIFRDANKNVLKFNPNHIITGINVIDDMLFWTDNHTEPKKINIPRCKAGTIQNGSSHTRLVNDSQGFINGIDPTTSQPVDIEEKHITVIKKTPPIPLEMKLVAFRDPEKLYTGVITVALDYDPTSPTPNTSSFTSATRRNFNGITTKDGSNIFNIRITEGVDSLGEVIPIGSINEHTDLTISPNGPGLTGWHKPNAMYPNPLNNNILEGTTIVFKPFDDDGTTPGLPVTDFVLKGFVVDSFNDPGPDEIFDTADDPATNIETTWSTAIKVKITSIDGKPPTPDTANGETELKYVVDLFDETEKLFEFKFPRFSYRYKYEDGEYSPFAPFTQVAFSPGSFDYHPRKGYNLGMTNRLKQVELGGFIHDDMPKDVVSVDILFKDEPSPNIYVVDTIRPDDAPDMVGTLNTWYSIKGDATNPPGYFVIKSETVNSVVPSNQLLRPWDNVPRKALAQDITGNRVVYGNYVQNYDLIIAPGTKYSADFNISDTRFQSPLSEAGKSIKSLREYQLGVVFVDKYGRETPVISNPSGTIKLGKEYADKNNRFSVAMRSQNVPEELIYYKFYVKETAGEYYNMAMDRWYDAGDGNIWLAFPSSDRNKIDIDSFLILKKGSDQSALVKEEARYKVIAIENEAPDFIKTNKLLISQETHTANNSLFTGSTSSAPLRGTDTLQLRYQPYHSSSGQNLDKLEDNLYIQFGKAGTYEISNRYKITSIANDWDQTVPGLIGAGGGDAVYSLQLDKQLGQDVDFISNDTTGVNSNSIVDFATVNIYKYKVESEARFDGRFFVKIYYDDVFQTNISTGKVILPEYRVSASKTIYSMRVNHEALHTSNVGDFLTGGQIAIPWSFTYLLTHHISENYGAYDRPFFTSFALYFRKYQKEEIIAPGAGAKNALIHLKPTSSSPTSTYLGKDWKSADDGKEYGVNVMLGIGVLNEENYGYTANLWQPNAAQLAVNFSQHVPSLSEDRPKDTEVWFIDGGPRMANRTSGYDLNWGGLSNMGLLKFGSGLNDSYTNTWFMDLSYGGIQPPSPWDPDPSSSGQGVTPGFFNIGDWNSTGGSTNGKYMDVEYKDWVDKMNGGSKFRWKEDPNPDNIYTIQATTSGAGSGQHLRHSWIRDDGYAFDSTGELISFNFTKNWRSKITPGIAWNPYKKGEIAGGMTIKIPAVGNGVGTTCTGANIGIDLKIFVADIVHVNSDGTLDTTKTLHVGMALQSYFVDGGVAGGSPIEDKLNVPTHLGSVANKFLVIRHMVDLGTHWELWLGGYDKPMKQGLCLPAQGVCLSGAHRMANTAAYYPVAGENYTFVQVGMNGYSDNSEFNINMMGTDGGVGKVGAVGYTLEFLTEIIEENVLSENPAIWETEPKDAKDLDIYYEATGAIPMNFDETNIHEAFPIGSIIIGIVPGQPQITPKYTITGYSGLDVILDTTLPIFWLVVSSSTTPPTYYHVVRPDGLELEVTINAVTGVNVTIDPFLYNGHHKLPWHNCYSFGNGVESNRIRDNFNLPYIADGVKASTTLDQEYKEEHRKYGLIYSGLYNSTSGVNNLNQFIQAEKITKDINPIYGSIQKLHARDTDLVTLCEDKCLRILSNKDAVYNADGNPQLIATENVLGQTVPFSGEYGISTNPESFASESFRVYFTDKIRGAVMRLSKDGLTPISNHGMKDWFRDNLKLSGRIIGSYDSRQDEYNITLNPKLISYPIRILGSGEDDVDDPQA
jgi:hypothetical protein